MSAISCLNMNGMIGTSHTSSSKESLLTPCSPFFSSNVPFSCYLLPPISQSLDWVLMTVAAGHLGRPQSQLGGPVSPARYPLCPLPSVLSCPIWDQPPSCLAQSSPQTLGLLLLPLACPFAPPIPPHCSTQKRAPPLRSLFMQGQSNPSSCRLNLHTKDQCKDHQLCGYKSRVHSKTTHTRPLLQCMCI